MRATRDLQGVSAVVAIILLVAITVVLTGVLYIIVNNLATNVQEVPPRVLLTNIGTPAGEADFQVSTGGEAPHLLGEFQIRIWINGTLDNASIMNPVVAGTHGSVTFQDLDGGGRMSDGDRVIVSTAPSRTYSIFLLWKAGVTSHLDWQT